MYNCDSNIFEWGKDYYYKKLLRIENSLTEKLDTHKQKAESGKYERNHFGRWDYYISALERVHKEMSEIRQKYVDKLKREIYK